MTHLDKEIVHLLEGSSEKDVHLYYKLDEGCSMKVYSNKPAGTIYYWYDLYIRGVKKFTYPQKKYGVSLETFLKRLKALLNDDFEQMEKEAVENKIENKSYLRKER